ncbi:MAG TPA: DUF547 domain-containing protein [Burkholderiales bacterium]|nr:DUF547 domain-containing protein [Burkholderiales bacterium]
MRTIRLTLLAALAFCPAARAQSPAPAFDHTHGAWSALLARHVIVLERGHASRVRYAELAKDRESLRRYLDTLQKVAPAEFRSWTRAQRLAFLLNAYNAFTVEKILTRYPDLRSIWDFGRVFGQPFKDRFFTLLGRPASLDDIENDMLRVPGAYDDVRIHFALNCASLGCPMLRAEAYVADRLGAQLDDQITRFLTDRSRNRLDARTGRLGVSKIFHWAGKDWQRGTRNFDGSAAPIQSLEQFFAGHAKLLADDPAGVALIEARKAPIEFLDYDWSLNDAARTR